VVSEFVAQARAGETITVHGDGGQERNFVHVSDVVRANVRAAQTDEALGQAFNVGTGEATRIERVAELARAAVGAEAEIVYGEPREGDIRTSVADVSKARDQLGFEAKTEFVSGLRDTVAASGDSPP